MLFFIIIVVVGLVIWWRSYKLNTFDTVVAFTGGLGSGKSFMSAEMAIKLLRRQRRHVLLHNMLHPKTKWEKPLLYSSIPVRVSKREMATVLTDRHLLLQERLALRSVVYIDEVGGYCSQFDYRAINTDVFDEFIRFFRHYTQGGYLIVNDQCSENIVLQVRRRLNTVYNLMDFRMYPSKTFSLFYSVKVRNISVSEEIKTIEEQDTEDNMTTLIGLVPWSRRYDTYCYSHRYDRVKERTDTLHQGYKQDHILRMGKKKVESLDAKIARQDLDSKKMKNDVQIAQSQNCDHKLDFMQIAQNITNSQIGVDNQQ